MLAISAKTSKILILQRFGDTSYHIFIKDLKDNLLLDIIFLYSIFYSKSYISRNMRQYLILFTIDMNHQIQITSFKGKQF